MEKNSEGQTEANEYEYECGECGAKVTRDERVCPKCGADISDVEEDDEVETDNALEKELPAHEIGKCAKCGRSDASIEAYYFYFGKVTDTKVRGTPVGTETTVNYEIHQRPARVPICNGCVENQRKKKALIAAGMAFSMLLLFLLAKILANFDRRFWGLALPACFLFFPLLYFIGRARQPKESIGDEIAIRLHKKALKAKGYDVFIIREKSKVANNA